MNFDNRVFLSHFQLRNMISCASRNHIFYAGKRKVYQWDPTNASATSRRVAMNLTSSDVFFDSVQVSTITVGHNILFVGGFCGEYAMINLRAHKDTKPTEGIATYHDNAITNHVQIHGSRGSYMPQAAISSNDSHLRVLDIATNKIVATHEYEHAINCSTLSPDQRLRVLVGDSCEVMICHSDTGEILQSLEGHHDYGFACDWADDGWTIATGNQDGLVKIWDARKWRSSNGKAAPVTTIAAELAGVRKLKFSPLGSGKRVLVAAEAADIVNVIDAETFSRKQALNFFGEVGGFDFTNGGRDLFVAVCDDMRGGIMEFERADFASASMYEISNQADSKSHGRGLSRTGYDWRRTQEDVTYAAGSWGTLQRRRLGGGGPMVESMAYF
jgi:WD40 repeat protein